MKITTTLEDITPETASKYLERNVLNRPKRHNSIKSFARDMVAKNWAPNHQSIAFNDRNELIDGQNRLEAIILANIAVQMSVSRGWPQKMPGNSRVFTMDTVDGGNKRSVGDNLMLHGTSNGKVVAACCSVIATIALQDHPGKLSTPQSLRILGIYGPEVTAAVATMAHQPGLRSANVVGSAAFAMKSDKAKIEEFYSLLVSGEGLFKTGTTSPIYLIRKYIADALYADASGYTARWRFVLCVLNAMRHYVEGNQTQQLKYTTIGLEFFINRQKRQVAEVVEIVTL